MSRALVAVSAFATIFLPSDAAARHILIVYALLAGYVVFACGVLVPLRSASHEWTIPAIAAHMVDISFAVAVTVLTGGVTGPFFLLFLFTLLAAAYRWGLTETVMTAGAAVLLLAVEAAIFGEEPARLIVRSAYLLLTAVVAGYLAQNEKRQRFEVAAIATILRLADVRAGLRWTMAAVLDALLRLFESGRLLLVVRDNASGRWFVWEAVRSSDGSADGVRSMKLESGNSPTYMFMAEAADWHALRQHGPHGDDFDVLALDQAGSRIHPEWSFPPEFLTAVEPFDRLMALSVELDDWTGRLFLIDPVIGADRHGALGFGRRVVRQIAPAVQNVNLMHRLRSAAAATERGRIARELHDGVIQTVSGVEVQVAAMTLRVADESPALATELSRLTDALRQEVVNLRELMQQMKPLELNPDRLVDTLADFVQRFERETGIAARFVTQLDRVPLAPHACREVARILQEALVNIRRHSGARNVFVRLATVDGDCFLSIDDDGCGFPFRGRLSRADLEACRTGPAVINERVRLLGGELTIESEPGHGSRLEIAVPLSEYAIQR